MCFVWLEKVDARAFPPKNFIIVRVDFAIFLSHCSLKMIILVRFPTVINYIFSTNRFITTGDGWSHSRLSETVETQWKLGIIYNSSRIGNEGIKVSMHCFSYKKGKPAGLKTDAFSFTNTKSIYLGLIQADMYWNIK